MTNAVGTLRSAARDALARGDTVRASEIAAHILRELPRDVQTIRLYGEVALEHGALALAEHAFTAYLSAEPGDPVALTGLALVAEQRDHLEEALDLYGRALECNPFLPELRRQLERVSALSASPVPDWRSALARGVDQLRAGRYHDARDLLAGVADEQPDRPEAWLALMAACRGLGDGAGAEAAARAALEHAPNAVRALHVVAERALATGDELIAGRLFVEIWQLDPQGDLARDGVAAPRSTPVLGPLPPSTGEFVELRIRLAPTWPLQLRGQHGSAAARTVAADAPRTEPVEAASRSLPPPVAPEPPAPAPPEVAAVAPAVGVQDGRERRGILGWLRIFRRKPEAPAPVPAPVPLSRLVLEAREADRSPAPGASMPAHSPVESSVVTAERVPRAAPSPASSLPEPVDPAPAPATAARPVPAPAREPVEALPLALEPESPAPVAPQPAVARQRPEPRDFLRELLAGASQEGSQDIHVRLLASYFLELPGLDPEHFEQALRHQANGARGPAMAAAGAEILRRWQELRAPSEVAS